MSILADHTVLPPTDQSPDIDDLAAALASGREFHLVDESGHTFPLTAELQTVLAQALAALSAGQAVTLEPLRTLLSTQEAANLLGISRPTLVKLLESGDPVHQTRPPPPRPTPAPARLPTPTARAPP